MNPIISKIDKQVLELATPRQREVLGEVVACQSIPRAAENMGIAPSTVHSCIHAAITRAAKKGYSPEQGLNSVYPEGFNMEKVTIHERNGVVTETWARMHADKEKSLEMLRLAISAICEDVQPVAATTPEHTRYCNEDLMVNIPVGDAHIGMLAWGEECGTDYDLKIAESIHCRAVDMLIAQAPPAKYCTIIDLGDWMHSDNLLGVTTRGGNVLDMDGRWHKVLRTAIRIVVYYITQCLKKFDQVIFRPEVGNHNDSSAIATQEWLSILYQDEPRVTIGNTAGNVFFWQHGLCYFGSHHGHEIKFDKLPDIMAAEVMDNHLQTKFRKFYCGHIHHKTIRNTDFNTCEVQTYRTLCPKDAYSSSRGYHAPRDITAETWHKRYGQIGTVHVTIPMLEDYDG